MIFFANIVFLGICSDFLTVLIIGKNIDNTYGIVGILNYIWHAPLVIVAIYIGCELMIPKKKWTILLVFSGLAIIYELVLLLDIFGSLTFIYPENSGEELIDTQIIFGSPAFFPVAFFILSNIILLGFGCLLKSIQSTDILRKKFFYLAVGFFLYIIGAMFEVLTSPGIGLIFVRFGIGISSLFWYLGLREEPEKVKKTPTKKEVKIEGDLFRITKRPDQITEEEVSISKEKKICLVCKGKSLGFTFICRNCEIIYCDNCVKALIELENMCWACNAPIDESKPVKSFKKEEVDVEMTEKPPKRL